MKNKIRNEMKLKRRTMCKAEAAEKSRKATKFFLNSEIYRNVKTVMLYMPLGNETDTSDIIKQAFEDGKKIVLPVTEPKTGIITPYVFEKNTILEKGGFSVFEPKNAEIARKAEIDAVVVPGIAFDKTGTRVGFGKGCYDMFLDGTNVIKIGFCYEFQVVNRIDADEHDVRMDFLVTENGWRICED